MKFNRRPVPDHTLVLAEAILADFNAQAGTNYGAFTGRGQPSESLKRILGALETLPDLTLEDAAAMTRNVLAGDHYWTGPASVNVVFAPGVVERNHQAVKGGGTVHELSSAERVRRLNAGLPGHGGAA